jgi:Arc/MetJ family transcription regulator
MDLNGKDSSARVCSRRRCPYFSPSYLNRLFHGKGIRIAKWLFTRIIIRVKTTVELDEQKLLRVMELTGLKTRKEAIDYALSQAERAAKIAKLFARPRRSKDELKNLLDPKYDLMTLREQEKPRTQNARRFDHLHRSAASRGGYPFCTQAFSAERTALYLWSDSS